MLGRTTSASWIMIKLESDVERLKSHLEAATKSDEDLLQLIDVMDEITNLEKSTFLPQPARDLLIKLI